MRENRSWLFRLMRALNRIDDQYCRAQRKLGIKESLFVLLYMCSEDKGRSQKEICDEWCIPHTTLNTTVKVQEAAGRVELMSGQGKQKRVRLTESGHAYADEFLGALFDAEERAGGFIDDELVEGLEQFARRLEREFGKIDGVS